MEPDPVSPNPPKPPVQPPAPNPGIPQTFPRADGPPPPAPFTPATSPTQIPQTQPPPTPGPMPNVMVGDGGMVPPGPPGSAAAPALSPPPNSRKKVQKKLLLGAIGALLVLGGVAAWYFAYHMNPSVIYRQSLKNTGKGYDKLVTYVDQQEKLAEKGYTGNGSYKITSGDFSTDGKLALKSDANNSQLNFDVGLGVTRLRADVRTIKSSGNTPDIYVKATDIKGLGTVLGIPELDAGLAKLDDTWIVIDHTLIDNLSGLATAQAEASAFKGPTRDQVLDEARAFGKVNQEYLFSTAKDKAVIKVVKRYGMETVDGHKTYHYQAALEKDNVKKYITAQRDALKTTSLNGWLKQNKYDKEAYAAFDEAAKSTKDIKESETFDIWMDVNKRVVYKVRFSEKKNPADNYVDVGLDYEGGDVFPFFIAGKSKTEPPKLPPITTDCFNCGARAEAVPQTDEFSLVATLDTKTGNTGLKFDFKSEGSDEGTVNATFNFKPNGGNVKIDKPSGAKPLSQVLSELGFGDVLSQYTSPAGSAQGKARDAERKSDINSIYSQIEVFFAQNAFYPSLSDMNNNAWVAANLKGLDPDSLADPSNPDKSKQLAASPAANVYAYQVTDANGQSCEADDDKCATFILTATLEVPSNGQTTYVKTGSNN